MSSPDAASPETASPETASSDFDDSDSLLSVEERDHPVFQPRVPEGDPETGERIETGAVYRTICDDHRREEDAWLEVMIAQDSDVHVRAFQIDEYGEEAKQMPAIRKCTSFGGGRDLLTRQALLWLAEGIRRDEIEAEGGDLAEEEAGEDAWPTRETAGADADDLPLPLVSHWPKGVKTGVLYRTECDDKGRKGGSWLEVMVAQDGDVYVRMQDWEDMPEGRAKAVPSIRKRTSAGGGKDWRTKQALLWLAEAIRREGEVL